MTGPQTVMARRAQQLLDYLRTDPGSDGLLDALTFALLTPAGRLSLVAHGDLAGTVGPWQGLTDPAVCDLWALPYAAQWTGGVLPDRKAGETDADYGARARAEAIRPRGMRRGSPESLAVVAREYLTGSRTVRVVQRPGGEPWTVNVHVKAGEAPDHAALEAAVNDPLVITAGVRATVIYGDQPLWDEATVAWADVPGTVTAMNVTVADVR